MIFDVTKITIQGILVIVPCNLEVKWCIGRPNQGDIKIIIFGVLYYTPRSRRKGKMLDHLVSTIHDLLNRFNDAKIILGGDRNDLDLAPVYNSVPGLKQIQTEPTHKRKTIDIVATTMWRQYKQAIVVDPVDVDKPGFGKPSDHKCILLYPIDDQTQIRTVQYVLKRV